MKFQKVIENIGKQERPLSRIYGYRRNPDGHYEIVPDEAAVIRSVISSIATRISDSVEQITSDLLQQYQSKNIRNRSGRLWNHQALISLVKPIYCGIVISDFGIWRKSKIYPAIVSADIVRIALKRLKKET